GGGSWNATGWRGGTASGGGGSWNAKGAYGGTAHGGDGSWTATGEYRGTAHGGGGSWHGTGAYGGTASGGEGSWPATGANGTTAYGGYDHYYGGSYTTYHPPPVVNSYYGGGCYECGGWNSAGPAAVGLAAGTALGAAAGANAYAGGGYAMGAIYSTLPAGCIYRPLHAMAPFSRRPTGRMASTTAWCPGPEATRCACGGGTSPEDGQRPGRGPQVGPSRRRTC